MDETFDGFGSFANKMPQTSRDERSERSKGPITVLEPDESPIDFKGDTATQSLSDMDSREKQLAVSAKARLARDTFAAACRATDLDAADVELYSVKDALEEMWSYASVRSRAFHDLLGLLEAALKHRVLSDFEQTQRDVLTVAFHDLAKAFVEDSDVQSHLRSFAMNGIDVTGPVMCSPNTRRFRVIVEEID